MDVVEELWARVTTPLPQLPMTVLVGALLAAAVVVLSPALWRPARTVVTIAHQGAHGLVALAAARRLARLRLPSDTSGLTVSA